MSESGNTMLTLLNDAKSIEQAAKLVEMDRRNFKRICEQAGILIPWGGTKAHPRFKVKLSDAERAILAQKVAKTSVEPVSSKQTKLHRLVRC